MWDPDARIDLVEIVRFIAKNSLVDARRVAARLNAGAKSLMHHPQRCRCVPELSKMPDFTGLALALDVHVLIVRPWRLTFTIEDRAVPRAHEQE